MNKPFSNHEAIARKANAVPADYSEAVRAKWAGKLRFLSERGR